VCLCVCVCVCVCVYWLRCVCLCVGCDLAAMDDFDDVPVVQGAKALPQASFGGICNPVSSGFTLSRILALPITILDPRRPPRLFFFENLKRHAGGTWDDY
jgi:hypothetical protein